MGGRRRAAGHAVRQGAQVRAAGDPGILAMTGVPSLVRDGRIRKLGLAGLLVGGTLLFGVGLAGAQSSGGDGGSNGSTPTRYDQHTSPADVMIGGSAGSSGCHGDGGAT